MYEKHAPKINQEESGVRQDPTESETTLNKQTGTKERNKG
jgi:hypothetical protein